MISINIRDLISWLFEMISQRDDDKFSKKKQKESSNRKNMLTTLLKTMEKLGNTKTQLQWQFLKLDLG